MPMMSFLITFNNLNTSLFSCVREHLILDYMKIVGSVVSFFLGLIHTFFTYA